MSAAADALVIGAGIVGAACAYDLALRGRRVHVIDAGVVGGGATAAGMGHICLLDDSEAQYRLTRLSRDRWDALAPELPASAEREVCGTIWVAAAEDELAEAGRKAEYYRTRGIAAEVLDERQIREAEPFLRDGVLGGLLLREDSIVYAPVAAKWMIHRAVDRGGSLTLARRAVKIEPGRATLDNGTTLTAPIIVVATGIWAPELFDSIPVRPRKGHLAITDRYPGLCRHQLVELAYIKNAHGHSEESVSFNVQPRPTGQILIGSSRQYGRTTPEVEPRVMKQVLDRALEYLPALERVNIIRCWTGFRAATPDSLPVIGPHPAMPGVYLATGHEGLGLTTSLGTAALIAAHADGREPPIPPGPYLPARCLEPAYA